MGAIVWEKAPDEDVLGDCVSWQFGPPPGPVNGLPSTGQGGRIGAERDRQAAAQGARVPVPRRPRTAATASRWLSPEPASNA